jgi:hypothetical protein
MLQSQLAALALTAATLAASGCGGSSKSGSSATTSSGTTASTVAETAKPVTRAELVAKANAICRRMTAYRRTNSIKTVAEVAQVAPRIAAYEQAAANELAAIVAPPSVENEWKQVVSAVKTTAANTAKYGEYAKANNIAGAQAMISSATELDKRTSAVASRLGIVDCSNSI